MRSCHTFVPSLLLAGATFFSCATTPDFASDTSSLLATSTRPGSDADADAAAVATRESPNVEARRSSPWEVSVSGVGSNDDDFDAGGIQVAGSVGYYFNEIVELSARQNVSFLDPGEGIPEAWNGVTRVALDLHAPFDVFVPYAGANFGYVYGDSVKETFVAGPEAGVKVYLKEDVFVQGGAEYQFYFDDDDEIDEAFEDGQFLYNLAFGLRF